MAHYKRKKTKRCIRCTLCTRHRWLGNSADRKPIRDRRNQQGELTER